MKINFRDWLTWVRIFTITLIGSMYFWSLGTLKPWAWGYWSYEYLTTIIIAFIYLLYDIYVCRGRQLYRIENKLDALLGDRE